MLRSWFSHWCPRRDFPYSGFDHFVVEVEEEEVLQVVVGLHSSVFRSLTASNNSRNNFKTKHPTIQPFRIESPVQCHGKQCEWTLSQKTKMNHGNTLLFL